MFRAAHPLAPENAFESYVFPNFCLKFFLSYFRFNSLLPPFFLIFFFLFFLFFLFLFLILDTQI